MILLIKYGFELDDLYILSVSWISMETGQLYFQESNSQPEGLTLKGHFPKMNLKHPRHFELVNNFSVSIPKEKLPRHL